MITQFDDELWSEGSMYTVGMNGDQTFKKVIFTGTKMLNGRPIMVFQTEKNKQITVNPSYHAFTIEDEVEMNDVIFKQAIDGGAWKDNKEKKENG